MIIVTAIAALVLAGVLALVVYKTRTLHRNVKSTTIRDQAEEEALRLRRQEALADEYAARAHAAQVEIDIKTVRAGSLTKPSGLPANDVATNGKPTNGGAV